MAAQVQQMEQKTAGEYWQEFLAAHQVIALIYSTLVAVLRWIFGGHFIIALGRWAIMTGGRIAEISMLFSVLWITADRVAPKLVVTIPLHDQATSTAIIALSLLPEIILFHAVIVCHDHWRQAWQDGKLDKFHLVFAALYTIPTTMFIGMTIWTLVLTATTGTVITADGILLSARYLAGWFYSLVEMIYPFIARRYHRQVSASPALFDASEKSEEIEKLSEEIAALKALVKGLQQPEKVEQIEEESSSPEPELFEESLPEKDKDTDPEMPAIGPKITRKLPRKVLQISGDETPKSLPTTGELSKYFYTKSEAAKFAHVRMKDIQNALESGELSSPKNRPEMILKSSLDKFIAARKKSKVSA